MGERGVVGEELGEGEAGEKLGECPSVDPVLSGSFGLESKGSGEVITGEVVR